MPSRISFSREVVYLRALADTGNATIAAAEAGVSRSWAYVRRREDARFDGWCREMLAVAKARLPVQVRRDRYGGWSADKEERFIERLTQTCSVWMAAAAVGLSTVSAYYRRQCRPGFAAAWDEALRIGWPPADEPWIEAVHCYFEGREPPPDNPVRITGIDDVIQAMKNNRFGPRKPRVLRG